MFGQSLLSAFGIACTTDTDQLFATNQSVTSTATYQLNNATTSIPNNTYPGSAGDITYGTGKFGNAAVFNGSTSYIDTGVSIANQSFSISMWVNDSNPSSWDYIWGTTGSGAVSGYSMNIANNKIDVILRNTSGQPDIARAQGGTISSNTWHNIVFTHDDSGSGTNTFYIDGVQPSADFGSLPFTGKPPSNSTSIYLGSSGSYNVDRFDGSIDQVRIFNTALPQAAVTALYNETTTTAANASIDYIVGNPNSIAYYKMSDATDQLGNYNGTATNVNFNTEGKFGFAGGFNGSSSKIDIASTITGNNSFSVSFWLNPTANNVTPFMMGNAATGQAFLTFVTGNILNFGRGGDSLGSTTSNTIPNNTWTHIVVSSNAGSVIVYVNGVSNLTFSTTYNIGSGGTFIGYASGYGQYFNGKIDQIRMYDSAISAADVTTLYKEVECEPAAINALANFNTVLYTGNSGTQAVTGVGFKPGFTWIKRRDDGTKYHNLFDPVRGASERLFSNTSSAQSFFNQSLTSFDNDGFSVGNDADVNVGSIVAWNWKAALANLSTSFNGSSSNIQFTQPISSGSPNSFSVSTWIKFDSIHTSSFRALIGQGTTPRTTMALNFYGNGSGGPSCSLEVYQNGKQRYSSSYQTVAQYNYSSKVWYHLAVTYNHSNTTATVYVNGSVAGSPYTVPEVGNYTAGTDTVIGRYDSGGYGWQGDIAQFRIFNDVLTASEVSDLYTEPAASNNTLNYPAGAGCIAAYPLQTNAVDLSGNYSGASSNVTFGQPGYLTGNTNGIIPSTVAVNAEAGFSIVKWTSSSTASDTIGSGLDKRVEFLITKKLNGTRDWHCWHKDLPNNGYLALNSTGGESTPNGNRATVTNDNTFIAESTSGDSMIAYCFRSIPGYSKIGSYVGTGGALDIYCGFKPAWVLFKSTSSGAANVYWTLFDNKRNPVNPRDCEIYPNSADREYCVNRGVNFTNTGIGLLSNSYPNESGVTFIYMAIA